MLPSNQNPERFRGYRNSFSRKLSDRAFHLQLDQTLELYAVLHGELAHEIVDETVNAQTHRLRLAETALLHVENLLGAHLADTGFVLNGIACATHGDSRIRVRSRRRVDEKRVALGVVFTMLQMLRHVDQSAVSRATFSDRDRFRDNVAGRLIGSVNHLRASVLVLAVVGERDGENFAACFATLHNYTGIFHRESGADVAIDPFYLGVFVREPAFRHEVENVGSPVLHRDVLDLSAF